MNRDSVKTVFGPAAQPNSADDEVYSALQTAWGAFVPGQSFFLREVFFVLSGEGKIWRPVEVSGEKDAHCADDEEKNGGPETHLVNHLPNQYPAFNFLYLEIKNIDKRNT